MPALLAALLPALALATPPAPKAAAPKAAVASPAVVVRGQPLAGAPAVTLEALLARPEAYAGKTVRLEAPVRRACTRKGCWMELAAGEDAAGVRVTFKDYGFFVPLDAAGARARAEGVVQVAELSEEKAAHLAEEGARVARGADGKPREVQLVATGVELRR